MSPIATDADFLVPIHRLACMQYLATLVEAGYHYWHTGSVHYSKAAGFLAKMRSLYAIEATPGQRAVAKTKGTANVQLVMWLDQLTTGHVRWYLLATPGRRRVDPVTGKVDDEQGFTDLIFQRESMKDAHRIPLTWMGHYRLVRHQKAADPQKRQSRKPVWTWLLTKETYRDWEARLTDAARAGNRALYREFRPILTSPMFSGVRENIGDLAKAAEVSFRKQHRGSTYQSPMPLVLPYVTKVKVFQDGTLLSLVEQLRQEDADAKARAMAAAKVIVSGVEPPAQYTQSLKEKAHGSAQEEGSHGPA